MKDWTLRLTVVSLYSGVSSGVWQARRTTSCPLQLQLQPCPAGLLIGSPTSCLPACHWSSWLISHHPFRFFLPPHTQSESGHEGLGRGEVLCPAALPNLSRVFHLTLFWFLFALYLISVVVFLTPSSWVWFSWSLMWSRRREHSTTHWHKH